MQDHICDLSVARAKLTAKRQPHKKSPETRTNTSKDNFSFGLQICIRIRGLSPPISPVTSSRHNLPLDIFDQSNNNDAN